MKKIIFVIVFLFSCRSSKNTVESMEPTITDDDQDGVDALLDCDDSDPLIFPEADEICDGIDNDCDGLIDDDDSDVIGTIESYPDVDQDGFGDDLEMVSSCQSPEGYIELGGDCNDNDELFFPGAEESCSDLSDYNCDGSVAFEDVDQDGWAACLDCNDQDANANPGLEEQCDGVDNNCDGSIDEGVTILFYIDQDGDLFGDSSVSIEACSPPEGFVDNDLDCNDINLMIYPGADELCDFEDNNCDGVLDEETAVDALEWYADMDGDLYGDPLNSLFSCQQPQNHVSDNTDCDDGSASIHPEADEYCDSIDSDCDGSLDEDDSLDALTWYFDGDQDGYGDSLAQSQSCSQPAGYVSNDMDCDDNNNLRSPDQSEVCNSIDDDCDGIIDEGDAIDALSFYADTDGDGFGDDAVISLACSQPSGFVADNTDCNDTDLSISPSETETCDGVDNNCSGDESDASDQSFFYADTDGDGFGDSNLIETSCFASSGYVVLNTDCDDSEPDNFPGNIEVCDGMDNNCSGDEADTTDGLEWHPDLDLDGYGDPLDSIFACSQPQFYVSDSTDCEDDQILINPAADELCNGVDDNCDGSIDEATAIDAPMWFEDIDQDGYGSGVTTVQCDQPSGFVVMGGDCDDNSSVYSPAAPEGCDGEDYNCDSLIDNDLDQDGYADAICGGDDCNDNDNGSYPNTGDCFFSSCNEILIEGYSVGDGIYTIDPDGPYNGSDPFDVSCDMSIDDGGWTIIDYSMYSGWASYFSSWSVRNSSAVSPSGYASEYSWREWFSLDDSLTEFRLSEDCMSIELAVSDQVYRMTGDHYGCFWYNTNCPMSGDTCNVCTNPFGQVNNGSCWHLTGSSSSDYSQPQGDSWTCSNHWWNSGPSLGVSGRFCVAYR